MKKILWVICLLAFWPAFLSAQAQHNLPKVTIAGIAGGSIPKDSLLVAGKLELSDTNYVITSFTLTMEENTDLVSRTALSATLTEVQIRSIRNAPAGHKIFFEAILVTDARGVSYKLPPVSFTLK